MKNIKTYMEFAQINESLSDFLIISGALFGSLVGLSLTPTIYKKAKEMVGKLPYVKNMMKKIRDSERFEEYKILIKEFIKSPTQSKQKEILDGFRDILSKEELSKMREMVKTTSKKLKDEASKKI